MIIISDLHKSGGGPKVSPSDVTGLDGMIRLVEGE